MWQCYLGFTLRPHACSGGQEEGHGAAAAMLGATLLISSLAVALQVKYAPQEQGTVEYQAKLEGFMQPRRYGEGVGLEGSVPRHWSVDSTDYR